MASSDDSEKAIMERALLSLDPVDVATAEKLLIEAKQIMDELGVVFFLRQGTLLGAIREQRIIPWDDDLDLASVIGLHGLTEELIERTVAAFRERGYATLVERSDHYIYAGAVKSSIRVDWMCFKVFGDSVYQYPGVRVPLTILRQLKEIDFIGAKFLVPDPPEEYLRLKYGADWMTPKRTGYERDIVEMAPVAPLPGRAGTLRQSLTIRFLPWRAGRIRVMDHEGEPVGGAEVVIAGLSRSITNRRGYAKFYLPRDDFYALIIRYAGQDEVLYEEKLAPGGRYVYRPDPLTDSGRFFALAQE